MIFGIWNIFLSIVGIVCFLIALGRWKDSYFRYRGVQIIPTYFPVIGQLFNILRKKEHIKDISQRVYTAFEGERYIGMYSFLQPMVVLRDLELIKQLTIKDFDHFTDHMIKEDTDPLFGNNLFSLKGQKWREMRMNLSPAFTSSKMRTMFDFVAEIGEQMSDYYVREMEKEENRVRGLIELEMKDAFTRYTNDVIATAAFGIKVNSFENRENEFYRMGKEATDFIGAGFFRFFLIIALPRIAKMFDITLFSKKISNFYRHLVLNAMKQREDENIVRPDMIQLLMEARKGALKHEEEKGEGKETGFATVEESTLGMQASKRNWTDDELVAQAVLFLSAGFDTSSLLICFAAHEMVIHPEIQRKLQEEIDEVAAKNNGKITYNDLQNMKYMDMVISETLRKWPPSVAIDRKCVKSIKIPPPNDNSDSDDFEIKVGDGIWIPVYPIHHDSKYFKNPEVFDPERFSDENKDDIKPFTYLPFGIGPRNCIGSRFALMEAKAAIFHLLHKFDLVPTAKTQNPIKIDNAAFILQPERGFWMGLKPRNK